MIPRNLLYSTVGLAALVAPAMADQPAVYPTPQKASFSGKYVKAPKVNVVKRSERPELSKRFDALPKISGAYILIVKPGEVTVLAHDDRGVFYAKQTLAQLLKGVKNARFAQKDPFAGKSLQDVARMGELAECEIVDWPDVEFRGTVEGFYGTPWSHESRKKQLEFYGRNKMNTYIYGPKDDPYHSAQWRKPYPEKEAQQIRELVQVAKDNHVDFVWAIHPGGSIKWTDEDMHNVIKKFELMYQMGVRNFSVFFDDIGGEGTRADKQAELLNMIHNEFVVPKGDVGPLVMCPTQYNRSWTSGDYLDVLGKELDPSTHVMWTGNTVVHDITLEGQKWVNNRLRRPSYVWWNFPVTDFVRDHLTLGRVYGLAQDPEAKKEMSGFVSNPMDKPEASKIALFGVADYTWNTEGFKSDPSWKEGIRRLFPSCPEAMQTFADHNSDLGPNGHGYRREESVAIAPTVQALLEGLKSGKIDEKAKAAMLKEYAGIAASAARIMQSCDSPEFVRETKPWLLSFEQLGNVGTNALKALDSKNPVQELVAATTALDEMNRLSKLYNSNPYQPGVKVGSLVMTPAATEVTKYVAGKVQEKLTGVNPAHAKFIVQGGSPEGADKLFDNNENSFWHSGSYQKAGDWYGVDYGTVIPIRSLDFYMGAPGKDKDFVAKGQLEYSTDMAAWKPYGEPTTGNRVSLDLSKSPLMARALRYRVIEPNYIDPDKKGNAVWTAIRELSVNKALPPTAVSTVKGQEGIRVQQTDKLIGINRVMEVTSCKPGDSITLSFPVAIAPTWLEINLGCRDLPDWADVQLTLEDGKTVPAKLHEWQPGKFVAKEDALPKERIRAVKLTNRSEQAKDIKIEMFKVDVPPSDPSKNVSSLTDSDLLSVYRCDAPLDVTVQVPEGSTKGVVIGSAACAVEADGKQVADKGAAPQQSFTLPAGTKAIRLQYGKAQEGKSLNEVIFTK